MFTRRAVVLVALALAACAPREPEVAVIGRFTVQQFSTLRWVEGTWRGRLPDGGAFYERYRVVDDSTIAMQSFADSTLTVTSDSGRIALRDGTIADEGGAARWGATRVDSTGVEFAPMTGATNGFTWTKDRGDRWTATLIWTDKDGRLRTVVYPMERIAP